MKKNLSRIFIQPKNTFILVLSILLPSLLNAQTDPYDINGDGTLNILVIGTTESIKSGSEEFSPFQIRTELENILTDDPSLSLP
ncbi:MAG: hypothetical protein ACJAX3_002797, partial [Patiriisocius sp.]